MKKADNRIHKYRRRIAGGGWYQIKACDGKRCTMSEHVSYFWRKVTCRQCLATKEA